MEKDKKQEIECEVFDCKYCDCNKCCCELGKIKVCSCSDEEEKEGTMCDSYKKKKHY